MNNRIQILRVISFNAHSIKNKIHEFKEFIDEWSPDIIAIQETHTNPADAINIPNYKCYRNDRLNFRGGGTAVLVHHKYNSFQLNNFQFTNFEATVVGIHAVNNSIFTIASIYLPPNNIFMPREINPLFNINNSTFICGDFNSKHPSWSPQSTANRNGTRLRRFLLHSNYNIFPPDEPTCFVNRAAPSTIDLAISNNNTLLQTKVINALSSDHNPVLFDFCPLNKLPENLNTVTTTNWANFTKMVDEAISAKPTINSTSDIDKSIDALTQTIKDCHITNSSTKIVNSNFKRTTPSYIKDLIKHKNRIRKMWQNYRDPAHKLELNRLIKQIKSLLRNEHNKNWEEFVSGLNPEDNSLYSLKRKLQNKKIDIPPLMGPNGAVTSDEDKANLLAETLSNNVQPNYNNLNRILINNTINNNNNYFLNPPPDINMENAITSPIEIINIINNLKVKKAAGPDNISTNTIKNLPLKAIVLINNIFNKCILLKYFPTAWKQAHTIFIPKPGLDKKDPNNYRPISLLNIMAKIFEKVIYKRLLNFTNTNNIIPDEQFGFRASHSTNHQLLRLINTIYEGYNNKYYTAGIFLDIKKAFDKVWHDGIIHKLIHFNFPPYLIFLIKSFLNNRKFKAKYKNSLSNNFSMAAGTPQGSIISPLLFTIFTADIPKSDYASICLFADDTAVLVQDKKKDSLSLKLQLYVNSLQEWFSDWRFSINVNKTAAIYFTKGSPSIFPPNILLFGTPLPWTNDTKYLGIYIDRKLTFIKHKNHIDRKFYAANNILRPLIGYNSKLSIKNKLLIYKTVVRPTLTYGCQIWGQAANVHINHIQILQNKILRQILNAPRRMPRYIMHKDLKIETIRQLIQSHSINFFNNVATHPNPLINIQNIPNTNTDIHKNPHSNTTLANICPILRQINLCAN